jgi:hypothetical protein
MMGASSIASGFPIAIVAAVVAGSKRPRRSDMANIGAFKKVDGKFQGGHPGSRSSSFRFRGGTTLLIFTEN